MGRATVVMVEVFYSKSETCCYLWRRYFPLRVTGRGNVHQAMVTVSTYSNMGNMLLWWRYFALKVKPVAMAEVFPQRVSQWVTYALTLLDLLIDIDTRFSAFYRLASRLNYKLKNLRLELFRTFLISSFQWRTLYWPQMSFSTSFILKKKVILQGK